MKLHYLNLEDVEIKSDIEKKLAEDGPLAYPIGRYFPTARTNIIQVQDDLITACLQLIDYLEDKGYCIDYITYNATSLREEYKKKPAFYSNLHKKIVSLIRSNLGLNSDERPNYTLWNSGKNNYHAFYVDSKCFNSDSEVARRSIKKMRRQSTEDSSNGPQKAYKALLELALKIHLAKHLKDNFQTPASKENSISKQIVTDNEICFLVKVNENKKYNIYHLLKPEINVTYKDEVVVGLKYQRYMSTFLDPNASVTKEVDVFIPNKVPWGKFSKDRDTLEKDLSDSSKYFIKLAATSDSQGIKFIDTYDIGASKLFYYSVLMSVVSNILKEIGTEFENVMFAPTARWRGFAKVDFEQTQKEEKPVLWLVNSIPDWVLDQKQEVKINFKRKENNPDKDATTEPITVEAKAGDIVDSYIEALKTLLSEDYKVNVYRAKDLTLQGIKKGVRIVVLQSPKTKEFKGYPYITESKTIDIIKELLPEVDLMYDMDAQHDFNINDKEIKDSDDYDISRDTNFLNVRYKRDKTQSESGSVLVTDFYSALKLQALDDIADRGINENTTDDMYITQGFHIPSYSSIAAELMVEVLVPKATLLEMDKAGFIPDDPVEKRGGGSCIDTSALSKAKIDLELKHMLSDKTSFRLVDNENKPKDISMLCGRYCGYYILNPRKSQGIASRFEFEITSDGYINQISSSIIEDINQIRYDETFPVTEKSVEKLYNDAFYLVDSDMNVLTSYSNLREPQVLDSVAEAGWAKGMNLADLYYYAIENNDKRLFSTKDPEKVYLNRTLSLKDVKGSYDEYYDHKSHANLTINFFALLSQRDGTFKSDGKTIGGREWIYFSESDDDSLLLYLSDKQILNKAKQKNNRVYRLIVRGHDGSHIPVVDHPLAMLYIMTANFGINRYNNPSVTSLLHTLTKMILKN